MRTLRNLALLFTLAFISSCNQEKKSDDPEVLKKIISDYFDGIGNRDINKMNSVTTKDFILFEDGKIWNNDSLINFVNTFDPFQVSWTFDYKRATIDALSGNIVYLNHGDFIFNDTTEMKLDWIESATFIKIDGEWKINFLHSTAKK